MNKPLRNTENPFITERRRNVQAVRQYITDNPHTTHRKIVAIFGIYGLKEHTINDYLEKLTAAGFIQFDGKSETYKATGGDSG